MTIKKGYLSPRILEAKRSTKKLNRHVLVILALSRCYSSIFDGLVLFYVIVCFSLIRTVPPSLVSQLIVAARISTFGQNQLAAGVIAPSLSFEFETFKIFAQPLPGQSWYGSILFTRFISSLGCQPAHTPISTGSGPHNPAHNPLSLTYHQAPKPSPPPTTSISAR